MAKLHGIGFYKTSEGKAIAQRIESELIALSHDPNRFLYRGFGCNPGKLDRLYEQELIAHLKN